MLVRRPGEAAGDIVEFVDGGTDCAEGYDRAPTPSPDARRCRTLNECKCVHGVAAYGAGAPGRVSEASHARSRSASRSWAASASLPGIRWP